MPTVQAALEHAISLIAGEPISVIVAGRTDTGVHATAQVVHFDTSAHRPSQAWIRGVNAHLPQGIAVWHAQHVAAHFHARFDAYGRHYRYLLQSAPVRSPLLVGKVGWTHLDLDIKLMQQAAKLLEGKKTFPASALPCVRQNRLLKHFIAPTSAARPNCSSSIYTAMPFYTTWCATSWGHWSMSAIRSSALTILPI